MVSSLLVTLGALQGVRAWGTLGHATVAYIAQNYVTDEVATWYIAHTIPTYPQEGCQEPLR